MRKYKQRPPDGDARTVTIGPPLMAVLLVMVVLVKRKEPPTM